MIQLRVESRANESLEVERQSQSDGEREREIVLQHKHIDTHENNNCLRTL